MPAAEPKVSVLIPNYNYAQFLPQAIDSVLQQDLPDFELLISDDASSDDSDRVLARYARADDRIRCQIHPANLGPAENWNWCLSQARGEHVKFLMADDRLANLDSLRRLVELMEKYPAATLAGSARQLINGNSQPLGVCDEFGRAGLHRGAAVIARCLISGANLIGEPSAVMFRRRDAIGLAFNPAYRQLLDLEMWFRLLERGDLVYTPEPCCCFRRHERQLTAVNQFRAIGNDETTRLFSQYHRKPCSAGFGFRRLLFEHIYRLKQEVNLPPAGLQAKHDLISELGKLWYTCFWFRRRLIRPFENLKRWATKGL